MAPPLAAVEDSALIKLALAGQTESFAVLTNRYLPAVRRHIGSMVRNATDADDILQDVLLKVWCHLSTFRSESTFRTWMTTVAINEAFQYFRRRHTRATFQGSLDFDIFVSRNESPLQSLTRTETIQVVRRAVVQLPPKYRQALILRHLEQRSLSETAQLLQLSVGALKSRLFRARRMLSATLPRPGGSRIDELGDASKPVRPFRTTSEDRQMSAPAILNSPAERLAPALPLGVLI
jgi:RNA polymerase sigma-70 factor (ECF subfamily)